MRSRADHERRDAPALRHSDAVRGTMIDSELCEEERAGWSASSGRNNSHPTVSAVVVHHNDPVHLEVCLLALRADPWVSETIVVDNASTPQALERVRAALQDEQLILSTSNLGFGGGANLGAEESSSDVLVFLNPDTVPDQGCIPALAEHLVERGGVAGPVVRTGSKATPEFGCTVDRMLLLRGLESPIPPLYVSGCCLATTRRCFDAVGGFDARYFLFVEDVEFCWQALRRGFPVDVVGAAGLSHVGGAVAEGGYRRQGRIETTSSRILLRERNSWALLLACAPGRRVPELVLLSLVRTVVFTLLLGGRGALRDVGRLWAGLPWNLSQLPGTLERRWRRGVTREGEQVAWARVARQSFLWDLTRRGERIRFVDGAAQGARS